MTNLSNALAVGGAAFIYAAVVGPLIGAYSRWKSDPSREIVHRRNVFGTFVPDLKRKRVERLLWLLAACVALMGVASLAAIYSSPMQTPIVIRPIKTP